MMGARPSLGRQTYTFTARSTSRLAPPTCCPADFLALQGCPDWLKDSNPACTSASAPCACAAWQSFCIGEVHMVVNCPIGVPNYRKGFDVYDASTGIKEDISKVVIKDGEVALSTQSTPLF